MADWAETRAREWINERGGLVVSDDYCIESLAALLREVAAPRLSTEAEALRVMGQGQPLVKMREIR